MRKESFTNYHYDSTALLLREIAHYPLLDKDQERTLSLAWQLYQDQASLNRLVSCNMRLVITIAKNYAMGPVTWEDLMGAGYEGLIKAAKTFDPDKNVRFVVHGTNWIKKKVIEDLTCRLNMIHVSESQQRTYSKVCKCMDKFEKAYQRKPTASEVSDLTGTSVDNVKKALDSAYTVASYDTPIGDDADSTTFIETMYDADQPMPDSAVSQQTEQAYVVSILKPRLHSEENAVLFYYRNVLCNPDKLQQFMDEHNINEKELVRRMNAALAILRSDYDLQRQLRSLIS